MSPRISSTQEERGTDDAALASVCTEARLSKLLEDWRWDAVKDNAYHVVAGAWGFVDGGFYLDTSLFNSSTDLNDEITLPLYARTTSPVTLNIRGETTNVHGISTIYIDGVSQGTIDWYSAGAVYDVIKTLSITPARVGLNAMSIKVTDKNPASLDYRIRFSEMWLS